MTVAARCAALFVVAVCSAWSAIAAEVKLHLIGDFYAFTPPYVSNSLAFGATRTSWLEFSLPFNAAIYAATEDNWKFDSSVTGLAASVRWDVTSRPINFCLVACDLTRDSVPTIRGQFGFVYDKSFFYVTGTVKQEGFQTDFLELSQSRWNAFGLGAGIQYTLSPYWSVWAEYERTQVASFGCAGGCATSSPISPKFESQTIRLGFSFKDWLKRLLWPDGDPDYPGPRRNVPDDDSQQTLASSLSWVTSRP
jgi:opacity protein-like surface antigen